MEHTQTESYDLSQPICENPQLALEALKQIIQANKDENNETAIFMTVKRCQTCGAWPTCRLDSDGQHVTIAIECPQNTDHPRIIGLWHETVKDIIRTWNHLNSNPFMDPAPLCEQKNDDAITSEMVENYDWDAPIGVDDKLLADVIQHCLKQQETGNGTTKMHICLCKDCCQPPMVFNKEHQGNTFFGCDNPKHASIPINANMSLTEVVESWNRLQGVPAEKTEDEPPKETSLDVMGRNALTLPQQTKTIEELEAEADRGLSKPEDVQKLKEANVLTDVQKAIAEVCDEIKELLLEKNRKYGNSALNPCRIFARSDRLEQIRVRIDDKLNRIKNEQGDEDEDVVKDLIGYLVLYTVAQLHDFNN